MIKGHESVVKCITDLGFTPKDILTKNKLQEALDRFNYQSEDDLYAAVGYGKSVL